MRNGKNVVIDMDDLDILADTPNIEEDLKKEGIFFGPDIPMLDRDIYGRVLPSGSSDDPFKREGFND